MEPPRYISLKKTSAFMIVGLAVFTAYLYFFVGSNDIIAIIKDINPIQFSIYYSAAILTIVISIFCWSAAWKTILKNLSIDVSYRNAYFYYWISSFTDLVIPCATVCGEITRLYLVEKETKADYGVIGASSVTNRIVAYTIVTVGLSAGSIIAMSRTDLPPIIFNLLILLVLGASAYLAVLLFLALYRKSANALLGAYLYIYRIFGKNPSQSKVEKTKQTLESFYDGFRFFREKPKLLIKPFIFHSLAYILNLFIIVFVFLALGINYVPVGFYIVVYFVAGAFQDAAASLSVGSLEILLAAIFMLYGVSSGVSAVAALMVRVILFWIPLFISFLCVQIFGMKSLYAKRAQK